MQQTVQQPVVVRAVHKAKADIFVVEKRKGGAVTDHHAPADRGIKHVLRGDLLLKKAYQHKVAGRPVYLKIRMIRQNIIHAVSLRSDQFFCLRDVSFVPGT